MPAILDQRLRFPDSRAAAGEGLVAIAGDLSAPRLRLAYRSGIFPWMVNPSTAWSPDPRGIFELERLNVPSSLAKFIRKQLFEINRDRAFRQVMQACATPASGRGETWVTPEFIAAYRHLHEQGNAHTSSAGAEANWPVASTV